MADISDVTAYLKQAAIAAVYPNGTSQRSVAGCVVKFVEGWPLPADLDAALAAGNAQVSVYPMQGTGVQVYQILDATYTISEAAITTEVSVAGDVITVSGTLSAGEFLTLVIDGAVACSQTGAHVAAMLAALAAQAVAAGYAATSNATTITIPFGHSLVVRQGGQAVLGNVTHRQRHCVMVSVWAPSPTIRTQLAKAIDVAIKVSNKVSMPDVSQALIVYSRTNLSDEQQSAMIYRRDLIYDAEYATVEQFPGYTITSADISITKMDSTATATALT